MPEFRFQDFEGPIDLLVYLIEKDRIDIYDIPIATLTDQYMAYLDEAKTMNLEVTSNFLLFAARLISIKVRLLMPRRPREEEATDPRQELVDRILMYRFYRETAQALDAMATNEAAYQPHRVNTALLQKMYEKKPLLRGLLTEELAHFAGMVLNRAPEETIELALQDASFSLEWMIQHILEACDAQPDGVHFKELLSSSVNREDIIVLFLALLECMHLEKVEIVQRQPFADIIIYPAVS